MALTSSSPGHGFESKLFSSNQSLVGAPSSPTAAYQDGEISPTFDASFASSMSITSDPIAEPSPISPPTRVSLVSPGEGSMMDYSPAAPQASAAARRLVTRRATQSSRDVPVLQEPLPPLDRARSQPALPVPAPSSDYPFLKSLFNKSSAASLSTSSSRSTSPESFLSGHGSLSTAASSISSGSTSRRELGPRPSFTTLPTTQPDRLKPQFGSQGGPLRSKLSGESVRASELHGALGKENGSEEPWGIAPLQLSGSSRSRAPIPPAWNSSRHTAPAGGLLQPPPLPPVKRLSEPSVPTFRTTAAVDSSPVRMDIDSSPGNLLSSPFSARPHNHPRSVSDTRLPDHPHHSPSTGSSGASDRIADFFSGQDLSPIPNSRKRLLDLEHSPTPGSSNCCVSIDSLVLTSAAPRRPFEKATTTNSISSLVARRRGSQSTLGMVNRRPVLAAVQSMGPPPVACNNAAVDHKRHAQQLNGKPTAQKGVRRAYSVADALAPNAFAPKEEPSAPDPSYRATIAADSYFQPVGGRRTGSNVSVDISMVDGHARRPSDKGSPLAGFRSQEVRGKILPCFAVKDDGLMRIDGQTLNRLQSGDFDDKVKQYLIIDCRFSWEFDGGHIAEAVNLPTSDEVVAALLQTRQPPEPSTSEAQPFDTKTVLIFHCEFSAKRAPTSAKILRSTDRAKNITIYPNVHYPEVYILQGGYADYFKGFPSRCVGGYLSMDDPEHIAKRSVDLNSFRHQQKRQFNRASSFTFGEGRAAAATLAAASSSTATFGPPIGTRKSSFERGTSKTLAPSNFVFPVTRQTSGGMMIEEEHETSGDSSFGTNPGSSPGVGDSPCPTSKVGRHSLKIGKEVGGRRPMERAQTSSILMFTR